MSTFPPTTTWPDRLSRRSALAGLALLSLTAGRHAAAASAAHPDELRIGGTGAALGTLRLLAQAYTRQHPQARITVLPSLGSGGGIKALLSGAIQLGVSARALTDGERGAGAVATEYGRTPLTFAVRRDHPLDALSLRQLTQYYAGSQDHWPDGSRIRLVLRPAGDADSELIKALSPALREAKTAAEQRKGMTFAVTDQECADALEKTPGGLGPISLAQLLSEGLALKPLALSGVVPSAKTVANGSYPLVKSLALVSGPTRTPLAQDFLAFVRSPAGRESLLQTGHHVA